MTDHKLTPREPTPEMVSAAARLDRMSLEAIWRAMHEVAPTVEAEPAIAEVTLADHHELEARIRWLLNPLPEGTLLYTHPAAPQPAALPELSETRGIRRLYEELVFAVGNKHPGETRHQTALRYIQQAEKSDVSSATSAALKGKQ